RRLHVAKEFRRWCSQQRASAALIGGEKPSANRPFSLSHKPNLIFLARRRLRHTEGIEQPHFLPFVPQDMPFSWHSAFGLSKITDAQTRGCQHFDNAALADQGLTQLRRFSDTGFGRCSLLGQSHAEFTQFPFTLRHSRVLAGQFSSEIAD